MALSGLSAGVVLLFLLRALGKSEALVLAFLWSPALIVETSHSAHVEGLVLPAVVLAWLACARGRSGWTGAALGAATALKLYPALLAPALWREGEDPPRPRASWLRLPAAFLASVTAAYLPYLHDGRNLLGYLPSYFGERSDTALSRAIAGIMARAGVDPRAFSTGILAAGLAAVSLALLVRPARDPENAIARCIWPISALALLSQNVQPWYLLWALPLATIFLRSGPLGLRLDVWTCALLASNLACLSYAIF